MFGVFKKKSPSALDALIRTVYGTNPPLARADLGRACILAHEELLGEMITEPEVSKCARQLFEGPIPYSTHDLAVATSLNFLKKPELSAQLWHVQAQAREKVAHWASEGKVVKPLAESFEVVLRKTFGDIEKGDANTSTESYSMAVPNGRAGERSLNAFRVSFLGPRFEEFVAQGQWDSQYNRTRSKCESRDPSSVAHGLVNGLADAIVANNETIKKRIPQDGWKIAGAFTAQGLVAQLVFAHAPALADALETPNKDRICFDIATAVSKTVADKANEMDREYKDGAQAQIQTFLANLFEA